jgi:hypothetical protein
MAKRYMDWADWAGDHPEQAEAELKAKREKAARQWAEHKLLVARSTIEDRDGADSAAMYAAERRTSCGHEDLDNQGVCANCGREVEGWEPTDAQIFAQYGQTMEPGVAA